MGRIRELRALFSWVRKSMINVWVGVSLIHSRPSTTSTNRSGSASRSGRCSFIVSGVALRYGGPVVHSDVASVAETQLFRILSALCPHYSRSLSAPFPQHLRNLSALFPRYFRIVTTP